MKRLRMSRFGGIILAFTACLLAFWLQQGISPLGVESVQPRSQRLGEVWQTVEANFFDPNFNQVDWPAMRDKYQPLAERSQSPEEEAAIINQMLQELQVSHTQFFTPQEPAYYQLLGIFLPRNDRLQEKVKPILPSGQPIYTGIGIFTLQHQGQTFISAILDGSPGAKAGLLVGDRILGADGKPFDPIGSFVGKVNEPVQLLIQRSPDPANQEEIAVVPQEYNGTTMFLEAMEESIQVMERGEAKIGYVHIWSYAGDQYQEKLEETLLFGELKNTDALVLDLRDGWGGAWPNYLNIFGEGLRITSVRRDGDRRTTASSWDKPVVLLVNERSRSGKEILAYGFQTLKLGPVVGSKTAGAVVAGTAFILEDGSLLYLAVSDVYLDDGKRLEGVGVVPDIEVPFTVNYAQGADPQKERAVAVATQLVQPRSQALR